MAAYFCETLAMVVAHFCNSILTKFSDISWKVLVKYLAGKMIKNPFEAGKVATIGFREGIRSDREKRSPDGKIPHSCKNISYRERFIFEQDQCKHWTSERVQFQRFFNPRKGRKNTNAHCLENKWGVIRGHLGPRGCSKSWNLPKNVIKFISHFCNAEMSRYIGVYVQKYKNKK